MGHRLCSCCLPHRSGDEGGGSGCRARPRPGIEILPFFDLVLVHNRGVTFGLLATDHPTGRWLLILLTSAVTTGLLVWLARVQSRLQAAALGLVDRLRHGAVTDFLDFHFQGYHWPAFNLADSRIVLGVLLLLLLINDLLAPAGQHQLTGGKG